MTMYQLPPNTSSQAGHHEGHPADGAPAQANGMDPAACLFAALSDRSRLLILKHLALGEHRVVDLTAHLGLAQSTVSKHLACLRDCHLVQVRAEGRASLYSLSHPAATQSLFAVAEKLLALTGEAVVLCPVVHSDTPYGRWPADD